MNVVRARERANSAIRRATASRSDRVFHYTTIPGMYGIVTSRTVWCSESGCLNDPSEIVYGHRVIEEVLDGHVDTSLTDFAARWRFEFYVASFTESEDSLTQWRAYSHDGIGVALRFKVSSLAGEYSGYNRLFGRVLYSHTRQRRLAQRVLDCYLPFLHGRLSAHDRSEARGQMLTQLTMLSAFFKEHPYGPENE